MTLILAFLAGALSLLSPCVLPLAPIVIAGARAQDPRGPLALALGLALAFGVAGGLLASLGAELDPDIMRKAAAAAMIGAGLVMLVPALGFLSERALRPLAGFGEALARRWPASGLAGFFAAGVVLAFVWAPCVGPTLGAAFALAASGGSPGAAIAAMFAFSLGAALSLLAVGYGFSRLGGRTRRAAGDALRGAQRAGAVAFALLLILIGAAVLTGFDRIVEAQALAVTPGWLIALTTRF